MALLELNNLIVRYGPIDAVKGVSMKVEEGKIVAILGANGAGKSTIIKTVGGVNKVASGTVVFNHRKINNWPTYRINKAGIITSPEGRLVFKELTVEENLLTGAYSLKTTKTAVMTEERENSAESVKIVKKKQIISRRRKVKENLERVFGYFPILKERKKQKASTLSGGEQQMLAIGRALMGSPKLLLLDEPSLGLAPMIIKDIFGIIRAIAKEGTTILIVEQNALQTLKICDYAYLMELGLVKAEGTSDVLLQDDSLISAYLGGHKKEGKI